MKTHLQTIRNSIIHILGIGFLCLGLGIHANAQTASGYSFTTATGTYVPLSGATSSSLAAAEDDAVSTAITIGFNFVFESTTYTQLKVSSNGAVIFGSAGTSTATNNLATATATQRPGVAPLWDDLLCSNGVTYQVSGIAPNRVFTMEWLNMRWNYTAAGPVMSFQVMLYETTNIIEFIYRQEGTAYTPGTTGGASAGIFGVATNQFISLQNLSSAPTTSTSVSTNDITVKPATGQIYRFTPPPPCTGAPVAQPSAMLFSALTGTQMTITYTNASPVPSRYLIVRYPTGATPTAPVNGTAYSAGQALGTGTVVNLVNGTSTVAAGLLPLTTYDFYAYSTSLCATGPEYNTTGPLTGTQATNQASNYNTTATGGLWSIPATWAGGIVPSVYDTATVVSGATLTVDIAATIGKLILNNNATVFMNNTLVDSTDLVINTGATFNSFFGTTGRQVTVRGNITNNGTLNMAMPSSVLVLNGITPQTVSGTGTFSLIPTLTVNNLTGAVLNSNLSVSNALNLTNGAVSGTGSLTMGVLSFNPTFAMTSTGGYLTCTAVSGLTGMFPGNATFTYNASTPVTTITTGNELNITAPGIIGVVFNAVTGGNIILGSNISVFNATVNDTVDVGTNTFTVNGNATFNATANIFGSGTFTMGANATITTSNLLGITTATTAGSVRTAIRNYSTTGNYVYNGAATQVTGDGLPVTLTGGTVTINTTSGTSLSQSTAFFNLTLSTNLLTNGFDATVNNIGNIGTLQVTGSGGFIAGANARLILGSTHASGVIQIPPSVNGNLINTGIRTFTAGTDLTISGSAVATGDGFPVTGVDTLELNQTTAVALTAATSVNALYITSTGRLNTNINGLTVLGTTAGSVTKTNTGYVDGPLTRTIGVGATGTFMFPVGIGATGNLTIEVINPVVTGSSVTMTAVARSLATGGTAGTGLTAIATNRYWAIAPVSGGTLSSVKNIKIYESTQTTLGATSKKIGMTTVIPTGAFNSIGGQLDSANVNILSGLTVGAFGTGSDSTYFVLGTGTASGSLAGGTYTVGPTGTYFSLTNAIASINEKASLTGPVILEFQTTYNPSVETYPLVFRTTLPTTVTNTLTIRPAAAVSSVINFTGGIYNATALIDFSGAAFVTIDGRPGGTGSNRYIAIRQTNFGNFATIRFINDAKNITLTRIRVEGNNNNATNGVIFIGGTNATGGNGNITIDNCDINGLSNSVNTIFASGTTAPADNKNISITNCNIYDFFLNGTSAAGVVLSSGNSACTISGNNFYQTAVRNSFSVPVMNSATNFRAIQLNNSASNAVFTVTNNRIGGNIPGIPASVFILGDSATNLSHLFRPIDCSNVGNVTPTSIQGNTISDITLFTNGTDNFTGIGVLQAGAYSVGNTTPNIVGSTTTNGNIKIYFRGTGAAVARGYHFTGTTGGTLQNNIVSGIDLMVQGSQAVGGSMTFSGVVVGATFTAPLTVTGNTIGSTTLANSLRGVAASIGSVGFHGIQLSGATGAAVSVSNNTVSNISSFPMAFTTNSSIRGINITGASSVSTTVSGNTITTLRVDAPNNATDVNSAVVGIHNNTTGVGAQFITNNTIHSLMTTYNGPVANVAQGIFYNSTNTSGLSQIQRNTIHSLETGSSNGFTSQAGINIGSASTALQVFNNFVRLGVNVNGTTNNVNASFYGILKQTTNNVSITFNTVYLAGSPTNTDSLVVSAALYKAVSGAVDTVMNNIFVNARSSVSGIGQHYAMYINNATGLRADANISFVSGTGGILFRNGGNRMTTLQAWRATQKPWEQRSAIGNPLLNAGIINAAATINFTLAATSPAARAGIALPYITIDQGGNVRTATPAIGSYDLGLSALTATNDIYSPLFTYTKSGNRASANTTFGNISVKDIGMGIATAGATAPKLWYKNATTGSVWSSVAPTSFTGTGNAAVFVYNFNWASIGGTPAVNDKIYYYFVAQDAATTPNIWYSQYSAADPIHSNVSTQTTPPSPTSVDSFVIALPLLTTINIPGSYPSLTGVGGFFEAVNAAALGGNTTVTIGADVNETGVNDLKNDGLGGYSLIIQPDASLRTLWGNTTTNMIRLNGVTKVTFDGGPGRNLRFVDSIGTTSSGSVGAVIEFMGGCSADTLVNCILEGNGSSTSRGTVTFGAGTNSNILIANCEIKSIDSMNRAANGIYSNNVGNSNLIIGGTTNRPGGNTIYDFTNMAINMTAVGDNVVVGHLTVESNGNNIYNRTSGAAMTFMSIATSDNHTIANNKLYQKSGNYSGNFTGILLGGTSNNLRVTRNSIGGSQPNRNGIALTSTGGYFRGVDISAGIATTSVVDSNYFSNIATTGSTGVFCIFINSGNVNVVKNIIGGGMNVFDTIQNGYDNGLINVNGGNIVLIQDNLISNTSYIKTGGDRTSGITVAAATSSTLTISRNIIHDIYHNGTGTTTTQYSVWGILVNAAPNACIIDSNIIYNIYTTNNGAGNYPSAGIHVLGAITNSKFTRNRIYNIGALNGTGTGTAAPSAYGFWIQAGTGNTYANNQITLGTNTIGQTLVYGVADASTGTDTYLNNSIFINGNTAGGANNSYGIYRISSGTVFTYNNLIYNKRTTSGTGKNFPLGSASAAGINGTNIQYNMMFSADTAVIAELPTGITNGWTGLNSLYTTTYNTNWAEKTAAVSPELLFTDTLVGNLGIVTTNPAAWYVNGKGIRIIGQTGDFNTTSGVRSGSILTGAIDIGSVEFTPTSIPADAYADKTPVNNDSTQFFFASRMIAKMVWGPTGTVPATIAAKYYSGTNPANTGAPKTYMNAYWSISQTGGSGYTHKLTLMQDSAILGNVDAVNELAITRYTGTGTAWTLASGGTSANNVTGFMSTNNNQTLVGIYTGTDVNTNTLPVKYTSFTAVALNDDAVLSWNTASEINNSGFEIERSIDGRQFDNVAFVKGAGNTSGIRNYHYTDAKAFELAKSDLLYYRLKQVDFDGTYTYSTIVKVNNTSDVSATLSLYPNPYTSELTVSFTSTDGNATIDMMDIQGKVVMSQVMQTKAGINTFPVNKASALQSGIYFVRIQANGQTQMVKLIKN
jgi:hypothetical protein